MQVNSLKQAFTTIENTKKGIPFDAIEYLYNHPPDDEIKEKIIFYLNNAYNDKVIYDQESSLYLNTPLWYAIIAENHLSPDLLEPLISLFTTTNDDSDFLDEQGSFVLGKLTEKFPELVIPKIIETIKEQIKQKTRYPYLFLFDALYHYHAKEYKEELLEILQDPNLYWVDTYLIIFSVLNIKEALPILHKMLQKYQKTKDFFARQTKVELEQTIKELESGKVEFADMSLPYYQIRGSWQEHYKRFEDKFLSYGEEKNAHQNALPKEIREMLAPPSRTRDEKIGRNDPCSCGSGKKYKKCCLNK